MKHYLAFLSVCVLTPALLPCQVDDSLAYQGRLKSRGLVVNGVADFQFVLYDVPTGGSTLSGPVRRTSVPVADGLFTVNLPFNPDVFDGQDLYLGVQVRFPAGVGSFLPLLPRQQLTSAPFALKTRGITVEDSPRRIVIGDNDHPVGIGTETPRARLNVRDDTSGGHVAIFDNDSGNRLADGIKIRINNGTGSTNRENNFITFVNRDETVVGRVEGFDVQNGDWVVPPPIPSVRFGVDIDPGQLPSASLTGGRLPTATFNRGVFPTLSCTTPRWPSVNCSNGQLPSATFGRGSLPSLVWNPSRLQITFNPGSLPSLTLDPGQFPTCSLSGGAFPFCTLSRGTLPSLSLYRGALPQLNWNAGRLPAFNGFNFTGPSVAELNALMCWALEQGAPETLTLAGAYSLAGPNGRAAALLAIEAAKQCKDEGVVYGSKGADYAEWLPKANGADRFQLGQIVGIRGGKVSLATDGAEQLMITSCKPIVLGNIPATGEVDDYVKVAFMGQVPVVVRGKVAAGDFILPSGLDDGTAIAVAAEDLVADHLDRIVGRAWSDGDNDVYSMVNVVVGVDGHESAIVLNRQRSVIDDLEAQNAALRAELTAMRDEHVGLADRLEAVEATLATLAPSPR